MKRHIPNFITMLNLVSGSLALYHVLKGNPGYAMAFITAAIVFDFLDGLLARILGAGSEMGKQLDSLSDLVSFGLVPAAMIYKVMYALIDPSGIGSFSDFSFTNRLVLLSVLFVPVFAALRLAKFNLQHASDVFFGLPTPAFALFWIGIYMDMHTNASIFGQEVNTWFVVVIMFMMGLFMLIPLPMLSLKIKNLKFKENVYQYLLLMISLLILIFTGLPGLPLVILSYILLSLVRIVLT